MAARDVSAQTDVSKMKAESDGSFKRTASTFRDFIAPNGKFPPEKGQSQVVLKSLEDIYTILNYYVDTTRMLCRPLPPLCVLRVS